ncbi:MAG TPA: hypothetical protein VGK48_15995 [Terriglobia bacterium]|jgi:hypothetical protein
MKSCLVALITITLMISQIAYAQAPIVSKDELKQALVDSAKTRKENLDQVRSFFSGNGPDQALQSAHIAPERVQKAVSALDDNELARLADQTRHIQNDFAAGALNNEQITYILIALATAVIVLILVK